jgi:cytochrome c oxidase subunit 1
MHFVGLHGMPRRVYTYPEGLGFELMNQIETAGSFVLMVAFLVFLYNVFVTSRKPRNAPADPWNGATLEWSIPSPPPEFNFAEIPTVHGRDALWEMKRQRGGQLPEPIRASGAGIHMPNPSYWPLVTAIGVLAVFVSLMVMGHTGVWGIVASFALLFLGVYKWAYEPAG